MMTRFQVSNYKCLANVALDLTPLHVVIGQNDAGKTSLLEAILALHRSTEVPVAEAFPGRWDGKDLVYDGAAEPRVELCGTYIKEGAGSPEDYRLSLRFLESGRGCEIVAATYGDDVEWNIRTGNPSLTAFVLRNHPGSLPEAEQRELSRIAETIGAAHLYRLDPKTMAVPAAIDPNRKFRLDRDGFGLASLLDDLLGYEPQLFLNIRREFCEYFPQFKSVRIETEVGLARQFAESGIHSSSQGSGKGIYFETVHGRSIRAGQASDGAILFLGLLALMYTPKPPKMLLIEEPEKGVYPKRLAEVIAMLRTLEAQSEERSVPQIILTTHSPYLLSAFRPEEVTLLSREGDTGPVRARTLSKAPHIHERLEGDEFYLGELWYNLSEDELFADA